MSEYFRNVVGKDFHFVIHNAKDEINEIKEMISVAKNEGRNYVFLNNVTESAKYWFQKQGFLVNDFYPQYGTVIRTRISWPIP